MKPPYVLITAACTVHGQFQVERKPNKTPRQNREQEGFYDAVKCPVCPFWASITSQIMVTTAPEKPAAAMTDTLPGMEG